MQFVIDLVMFEHILKTVFWIFGKYCKISFSCYFNSKLAIF